jgi:hypothetical protein
VSSGGAKGAEPRQRVVEAGAARGEAIEARLTRMLRAKHGLAQEDSFARVIYGRFVNTTTSEGGRSRISTNAEPFLFFTGIFSPTGCGPA